MTETQIQELLQNQSGGGGTGDLLTSLLQPLLPLLSLLFVVSIILTIIFVVYFVVSIVQKQRQHAAIMRIDKNLQKLIDKQESATVAHVVAQQSPEQRPPTTES